jgi:anti-sigma factor RsiW
MHNCKSTRNTLTDLALDEVQPDQKQQLLAELEDCAPCREEYVSIRETLRVSGQALSSTLPPAEFWTGYHARLVNRLENQPADVSPAVSSQKLQPWQSLWRMATASVRIPVPLVAAMLLLLFGVGTSLAWTLMKRASPGSETQAPPVITRTVTVPVTQEKIVTRIVYRGRNTNRQRAREPQYDLSEQQSGAPVAQSSGEATEKAPISLVGFKPTEQVKLKVLKGNYRDEK